jgi:hypothetical protein
MTGDTIAAMAPRGRVPSFYTTRSREALNELPSLSTQSDYAKELEAKTRLLAGTPSPFLLPSPPPLTILSPQRVVLKLVVEHFIGNFQKILLNQKLLLSHLLLNKQKHPPPNCSVLLMRMTTMTLI